MYGIGGKSMDGDADRYKKATFGAGCFWGVEAAFSSVPGVISTEVGYMGGTLKNPTYENVCTGTTGHAEVVQVTYDPKKVSYGHLLDIFWSVHDPTQLNRAGSRYRPELPIGNFLSRFRTGKNSQEIKGKPGSFRKIRVWEDYDHDPAGPEILPGRRIPPALSQKAWGVVHVLVTPVTNTVGSEQRNFVMKMIKQIKKESTTRKGCIRMSQSALFVKTFCVCLVLVSLAVSPGCTTAPSVPHDTTPVSPSHSTTVSPQPSVSAPATDPGQSVANIQLKGNVYGISTNPQVGIEIITFTIGLAQQAPETWT